MTGSGYKHLPVRLHTDRAETQHYVARDNVTQEQILSGDDDGVACLCFSRDMAETIARLLTNYQAAGGDV